MLSIINLFFPQEKKLVIPNQPLTDKTIRLTVVVSAQSIKPAENYYSNNNSSLIDFEDHFKTNQDFTKNFLKRRVSKEDIEDEYTKNQKISPNMENTFEKFIESKNLQKEPLININDNKECLAENFSRMTFKNNYNKDNVVIESLKMVSETSKKCEERSAEQLAQKNIALKKKFENLNRRKSKETDEALRSFDYEENQNTRKSFENVEDDNAATQKLAAIKKRSEALNSRKSRENEQALRSFNFEKNQNRRQSLELSVTEYTTFMAKSSEDGNENLENCLERMRAQEKIQLEQKMKDEETKKAQEKMLMERKVKHQSQCIDSRNLNDSDDFFLTKNTAEELKKLRADAKKMEKERKTKESKEEASRLLAERQERMNSIYSPDKIGMNADSIFDKNQNSISKYSTTSIDVGHHPTGIPKSTGAIKSK